MIRLIDVEKSYVEAGQRRAVLHSLSLEVPRGQFCAVLGKSGSGKSTLLHLLAGLDQPDRGQLWVGSACVSKMNATQSTLFRQQQIGFVFQFFQLIPTLSVRQNLELPLSLKRISGDIPQMLGRVGLADRANSYPEQLSGGEQQRLAVARALIHSPSLVLADEPTGNLDSETGQVVLELLVEMVKEKNTTLVMATHSQEAAQRADARYWLKSGQLVACS